METKKISAAKVAKNNLMAIVTYVKVNSNGLNGNRLSVTDVDNNQQFEVIGQSLVERMLSADQYDVEEKVTKTRAAEILSTAFGRPFTVKFQKQDESFRVLRGRLLKTEPLLGRSYVDDLDITEGSKTRLVDHREILELILDGTKYTVGK